MTHDVLWNDADNREPVVPPDQRNWRPGGRPEHPELVVRWTPSSVRSAGYGRRSMKPQRVQLRRNRIGTTRRRRPAGASPAGPAAVAGAAAVREEADHGDIPADHRFGARGARALGFVMGYNKIRAADVRVAEALSGIDVELTRRASLIPSLVQTVQMFAAREKGILDRVTNARAALTSATSGKSVGAAQRRRKGPRHRAGTAAGARPELSAAELAEQLPQPSRQPRRHREQAGLRAPVLQRRGGYS